MSDSKSVPIEELEAERMALRRSALHLASMILADASGSHGGGSLSQNGALLDLEMAAIRYVRRLDELAKNGSDGQPTSTESNQN
jgi:hypothetical protein